MHTSAWWQSRHWLAGELVLLFGVVPLAMFLGWVAPIWPILVGFTIAVLYLSASRDFRWRVAFRWPGDQGKAFRRVLVQFVVVAVLITLLMAWLRPDLFLRFPRERPDIFVLVVLLYPLVSVLPQEVLFRPFVHQRYAGLLPARSTMILVSGLVFGWAHVIFNVPEDPLRNPVAVPMTIVGGWLFAFTWEQTKSLWLVCFEHALYGTLIWTVGLGSYFYYGGQHGGG